MTKLSATQRATLERLAAGEYMTVIEDEGILRNTQARYSNTTEKIRSASAARLVDLGLAEIAFPLTRRFEGDRRGTYTISQAGRDAIGGNNEAE